MDDIAGCRLIFESIADLNAFRRKFHRSRFTHRLRNDPEKYNYIEHPKLSGYRGIHDIYEYLVESVGGQKFNSLLLEIQYRTIYQHAWATAVEVAGFITENAPKFGRGDQRHQDFFRYASEIISRAFENRPSCLGEKTNKDILAEFDAIEREITLLQALGAVRTANDDVASRGNVILVAVQGEALRLYTYDATGEALRSLFQFEQKEGSTADIVYVKATTNAELRSAFRNYFSDANDFVRFVTEGQNKLREEPDAKFTSSPPTEGS